MGPRIGIRGGAGLHVCAWADLLSRESRALVNRRLCYSCVYAPLHHNDLTTLVFVPPPLILAAVVFDAVGWMNVMLLAWVGWRLLGHVAGAQLPDTVSPYLRSIGHAIKAVVVLGTWVGHELSYHRFPALGWHPDIAR